MTLPYRLFAARARRAGLVPLLAAGIVTGAAAQQSAPPEGFQAGPLFVAPSLAVGLFADSNPFFRSTASVLPGEDLSDVVARFNPAVVATLPFHNSWFRLGYNGVFRDYRDPNAESNRSADFAAALSLLFATFDRLTLQADRSRGATDTIRFDGNEAIYDGTPYGFVTYEAAVERDVPGNRGYAANIRWSRLTFDSVTYPFFEYDGWEGAFELREAVNPRMWIVAGAAFRRFDHRLANDPTHAVYRQEQADGVQVGAQGISPRAQSWRAVLRYDRVDYPGGTGSNFRGLGGEVSVSLSPGPSSSVTIYVTRRPWSSFYLDNNYYLANVVGCQAVKRWRSRTSIGIDAYAARTSYPDSVPDPVSNVEIARRDRIIRGELYANVGVGDLYAFRFSYMHQSRNSNAGGVDYRADAFGVQFVLGWR